jgi:hydroxyacylglutathione hydrolase
MVGGGHDEKQVVAMSVSVQAIKMFSDNYAWLLRESGTGVVGVVDPADADAVMAAVDAAGGRLDVIFLTHHHADHVAGTDTVRARYGARVVGARADAHRLPLLDVAVAEGDEVAFGAARAAVMETPGHTRGHVAYVLPGDALLFCGDTLFSLGCGRLLEGSAAEMFASLGKFAALPAETLVYCGHEYTQGNARFALTVEPENAALRARAAEVDRLRAAGEATVPSRLADELAANPFMRAADAARLGEIRAAKDRF